MEYSMLQVEESLYELFIESLFDNPKKQKAYGY